MTPQVLTALLILCIGASMLAQVWAIAESYKEGNYLRIIRDAFTLFVLAFVTFTFVIPLSAATVNRIQ